MLNKNRVKPVLATSQHVMQTFVSCSAQNSCESITPLMPSARACLGLVAGTALLVSMQAVIASDELANDGWVAIPSSDFPDPANKATNNLPEALTPVPLDVPTAPSQFQNIPRTAKAPNATSSLPKTRTPVPLDAPADTSQLENAKAQKARSVGLRDRVLKMEARAAGGRRFAPLVPAVPLIKEFEDNPNNTNYAPSAEQQRDSQLLDPSAYARVQPDATDSVLSQPVSNLDMFVGELQVLGKVDVTRVAIGNGDIIRAEVLKTGELLIIGQTEGSTSLRLWNKNDTQTAYNIRVGANDPETRVRMERMVRMRVRMVEFRKRALGQLGIDWSDSTAGPSFSTAGDVISNNLFRPAAEGFDGLPNRVAPFSTYFGIASNITSRINFLTQNGDAVTLAEPVLSAVNGGQASFLAGGEVPYPTIGTNGQTTVEFKEYGVRLQVAPRIDAGGNIRTLVETEISQLDAAVSVNGAPGLLTRRAQTEVNVRSGQTIVISGLLSSESSEDVQSVPGLGRLPIIGRFFRSTNKSNDVRELVIFVTPEVIEPSGELLTEASQETYTRSTNQLRSVRESLPLME